MIGKNWIRKLPFLLNKDDERSLRVNSSILYSLLIKGASIIINFILVPVSLDFTNTEDYGIWLTISSLITMASFFDLGIGNGLRNKLAEALAKGELVTSRRLIGTAYLFTAIISFLLTGIWLLLNSVIDWVGILGLDSNRSAEFQTLFHIIIITFCIQFTAQLINTIYYALQKPAMVGLSFLLGSALSLLAMLALSMAGIKGLFWMGLAFVGGTILSLLLLTLKLFIMDRPDLKPVFTGIRRQEVRDLFALGGKFFLLQVVSIFQFQIANVLISRYLNSVDVVEYNVAYKLFSVVTMAFSILITPIWSAASEAIAKKDYEWIRSTAASLQKNWLLSMLGLVVLVLISPYLFYWWLGTSVEVRWVTSISIAIYVGLYTYSMIYVYFLNGMGLLNVQFYIAIALLILFFPAAYFFIVTLNLGIAGVSLALIFANVNGFIAAPIQFKSFLRSKIADSTL
ncbi:oligosaccharide flippase family protein [Flavihumibacter sp. RY-1]|uniref:Oligosaccharide flippase family protein n=1 Tax=Flavihumibacter fluminis TaxID=2909236 RepID=A0ABS9BGZ6_9BACT|nr:oligosaccharide flippase family protein [Flavihumibacter fluminis]MCF1714966.1 oligosaccharide flippase family protein [Flavihumibacter fluminis]